MVGVFSNKISRDDLNPGDHIYSWRHCYLYAHHGIYVGNGKVIHFTRGAEQEIGTGTVFDKFLVSSSPPRPSGTSCPTCGDQSNKHGVISSCLECFLSDGELYQFQYGVSPVIFLAKARGGTCTLAPSDPPEDVIHRAEYLLQKGFGVYNTFGNNCEDFAIYCKTSRLILTTVSEGRSSQASSFLGAAKAFVSSSLSGQASSVRAAANGLASSFLAGAKTFVSSPQSGGASSLLAAAKAIAPSPLCFLSTGFVGLTAVGGTIYCVSRYTSDIGVRGDVVKIPVEILVAHASLEEPDAAKEHFKTE